MNKKVVLILSGIIVVCIAVILLVINRTNDDSEVPVNPTTSNGGTQFPSGGNTNNSADDTLVIPAAGNQKITVNDIRNDENTTEAYGEYSFGGTVTGSMEYQLIYTNVDGFSIMLLDLPLGTVRLQAEREFISKLGITQAEACQLPVYVSTVAKVSEQYAGHSLGLSFCPGSVELP